MLLTKLRRYVRLTWRYWIFVRFLYQPCISHKTPPMQSSSSVMRSTTQGLLRSTKHNTGIYLHPVRVYYSDRRLDITSKFWKRIYLTITTEQGISNINSLRGLKASNGKYIVGILLGNAFMLQEIWLVLENILILLAINIKPRWQKETK